METHGERLAALLMFCPWRVMLPEPDGVTNTNDRYQLAFLARTYVSYGWQHSGSQSLNAGSSRSVSIVEGSTATV